MPVISQHFVGIFKTVFGVKAKPSLRKLAHQDVDDALEYDQSENADPAALGFIDTLEKAYAHIG